MNVTLEELFEAGVHFGHQLRRRNPKSKEFIFDNRNGVSIIDLEKTQKALKKACDFLEEIVASGKEALFVGTKRAAQELLREAAMSTQMPFCANRWMGGTLTNFTTIKKSLEKYKKFLQMEADGSLDKLPKKETSAIRREMSRMNRNFEGLLSVKELPAALFVVDAKNEANAVAEANRLNIPVIALVDTNTDPAPVSYPIPGNDDAVRSINLILNTIVEAIQSGLSRREEVKAKKVLKPVIGSEEFTNIEPEVTFSTDINLEEGDKKQQEEKPKQPPEVKEETKKEAPNQEAEAKPEKEKASPEASKEEK